jgi:hypothetical protein
MLVAPERRATGLIEVLSVSSVPVVEGSHKNPGTFEHIRDRLSKARPLSRNEFIGSISYFCFCFRGLNENSKPQMSLLNLEVRINKF